MPFSPPPPIEDKPTSKNRFIPPPPIEDTQKGKSGSTSGDSTFSMNPFSMNAVSEFATPIWDAAKGMAQRIAAGPQNTAESALQLGLGPVAPLIVDSAKAQFDQLRQATKHLKDKDYFESFGHGLAGLLPVAGPIAAGMGEAIGEKNPARAAGLGMMLAGPEIIPKVVRPVVKVVEAVPKALGEATVGLTTGVGRQSPKTLIENPNATVTDALRGKTPIYNIWEDATNALHEVKDQLSKRYVLDKSKLDLSVPIDITATKEAFIKSLTDEGMRIVPKKQVGFAPPEPSVKVSQGADLGGKLRVEGANPLPGETLGDFMERIKQQGAAPTESGTGMGGKVKIGIAKVDPAGMPRIQEAFDLIQKWGKNPEDLTFAGVDALKNQIRYLWKDIPGISPLIHRVTKSLDNLLVKNQPAYREMNARYEEGSRFVEELEKEFSLQRGGHPGTAIRKLQNALKQRNEYRENMLDALDAAAKTYPGLREKLAGWSMSSLEPRGLMGFGAGLGLTQIFHHLNPKTWLTLGMTSPRLMGELLLILGKARKPVAAGANAALSQPGASVISGGMMAQPVPPPPQ